MAQQHSQLSKDFKVNPDSPYDVVSYSDPEGRVYIRRHGPRNSSDVFEWSKGHGYDVTRTAERKGYRFMGAFVAHPSLRQHQIAKTLWDIEGYAEDDHDRVQWMRAVESFAGPRSTWPRVSLNGGYETTGINRTKMQFGSREKYYPNDALPEYVRTRRAGLAPEQQGWVPTAAKKREKKN
jgi:hypothetical protein